MTNLISARDGTALEDFITLSQEYVRWMLDEIRAQYPALDIHAFTAEHAYDDMRKKFPGEHIPPHGDLFIARHEGSACGCIALGRLDQTACEIRTLYVRPQVRGGGIGKQLVDTALKSACRLGYTHARLDTLRFMHGAQRLYRSLGFYDIPPYLDLPVSLQEYICFLELKL